MNSRSKPTGPRKSTARARKPATIDLEAKEVVDETAKKTQAAAKSETTNKAETASKPLGREGAKQSATKAAPQAEKNAAPKASPKPEEKPTVSQTPAPNAKSGGSFISGLIGATAAVVGLGAVGQYDGAKDIPLIGSLYSSGTEQTVGTDTSEQIASLTQQIEALKSSSAPVDLAPINDRLAKIEAAETSDGNNENTAGRLAEVETSLAEVTQTLSSIAEAAEEGAGASSGEIAAAIATVTQRLESLETSVGDLSDATAAPSEETTAKLSDLEAKIAEFSGAPSVDLAPIESKIDDIETSITSIKESIDSNSSSLQALSSQSSTLQETVASVKASEKVARSVAVSALGAALENDDPISLAIASIESLGGKTDETNRLAELSKTGVPTQKMLLVELSALTDMVQNPAVDTASGGIADKFWSNAKSLVSFRSSGPQEGNSAIAILSRVKANLETGDLTGVVAEWEKLPAETKQSGEAWFAKVNRRIEAFALYNTLSDKLSAQAG